MKETKRVDDECGQAKESALLRVEMTQAKETPGTWVYRSPDPAALVTTLYVRKAAWAQPPANITLMVEAADG